MNLTQEPEYVYWPETYYVFVEKAGPFMQNAPAAWGEAHAQVSALLEHNRITGYMSLYKMATSTYRAGFALEAPPSELPKGLTYEKFEGGRYVKFVLTGPYTQLGPATGRVMEMVKEQGIAVRDGWNIENYVNDPRVTPEAELISEILAPV
ncbi:MAG TPA: GyrI-like domain-containing protein [Terracidiphilus sp.]|jgi:effector-binding domain-containing protein|nr:GyrI-like domain-containing protein [Terracidiphilus sp.]